MDCKTNRLSNTWSTTVIPEKVMAGLMMSHCRSYHGVSQANACITMQQCATAATLVPVSQMLCDCWVRLQAAYFTELDSDHNSTLTDLSTKVSL